MFFVCARVCVRESFVGARLLQRRKDEQDVRPLREDGLPDRGAQVPGQGKSLVVSQYVYVYICVPVCERARALSETDPRARPCLALDLFTWRERCCCCCSHAPSLSFSLSFVRIPREPNFHASREGRSPRRAREKELEEKEKRGALVAIYLLPIRDDRLRAA